MLIASLVSECDFTDTKYATPVMGAHVLAQGATGRWCCVMWMGPEYLALTTQEVISREEAVRLALASENGSIDF